MVLVKTGHSDSTLELYFKIKDNQMKKLILGALLLSGPLTLTAESQYIDLDCGLLSLVDGTEHINIKEIFNFAKNIIALTRGTNVATIEQIDTIYKLNLPESVRLYARDSSKAGMLFFNNEYVTLKELVEYEKENPEDPELANAIHQALIIFSKLASDYEHDIQTAKSIMLQIIQDWSKLRNRKQTLMLEWARVAGTGREELENAMTTAHKLDIFIDDLLMFLKDLVRNCPKSYRKYRQNIKKK